LLPQSKLSVTLAVFLLLARFDDHIAYYTLERIFRERHGLVIPRQQMVQWVEQVASLLKPLYLLMFKRMKAGGYLQIDETPVKVMDPEVQGKWPAVTCGSMRCLGRCVPGFSGHPRSDAPHARLGDFQGTIQTDAYEVYDSLKKVIPNLVRIGCAAHARRKFHRALREGDRRAIAFIAQFRKLYRLEREAKNLAPETRHQLRQEQAAPIWANSSTSLGSAAPIAAPKQSGQSRELSGQRIRGAHRISPIPAYEIDNNLVENRFEVLRSDGAAGCSSVTPMRVGAAQ